MVVLAINGVFWEGRSADPAGEVVEVEEDALESVLDAVVVEGGLAVPIAASTGWLPMSRQTCINPRYRHGLSILSQLKV